MLQMLQGLGCMQLGNYVAQHLVVANAYCSKCEKCIV